MEAYRQLKDTIFCVSPMSEEAYMKGASCFEQKMLLKGKYFLQQGQVCRQAAFISRGLLRTFSVHEDSSQTTTCFCSENNFSIAFRSFLLQTPSQVSIQALEQTHLLVISYEDLQLLYEQNNAWQKLGRLLAEKEYLIMEKYAAVLNRETAKEKYLRLLQEQPAVVQRAPVHYIASYLGVSHETLSRIRKGVMSKAAPSVIR